MLPLNRRRNDSAPTLQIAATCPFRDLAAGICRAGFALPLDPQHRRGHCDSEDHDACALFLARLLRAGHPFDFRLRIGRLKKTAA